MLQLSRQDTCDESSVRTGALKAEGVAQRTFGVSVADFLDLQSTLETGGILISTTHDQQGLGVNQSILGQLLEMLVGGKDLVDLRRKFVQTVDDLIATLGQRDAIFGQLESHHDEGNVLRRVSLRKHTSVFW